MLFPREVSEPDAEIDRPDISFQTIGPITSVANREIHPVVVRIDRGAGRKAADVVPDQTIVAERSIREIGPLNVASTKTSLVFASVMSPRRKARRRLLPLSATSVPSSSDGVTAAKALGQHTDRIPPAGQNEPVIREVMRLTIEFRRFPFGHERLPVDCPLLAAINFRNTARNVRANCRGADYATNGRMLRKV